MNARCIIDRLGHAKWFWLEEDDSAFPYPVTLWFDEPMHLSAKGYLLKTLAAMSGGHRFVKADYGVYPDNPQKVLLHAGWLFKSQEEAHAFADQAMRRIPEIVKATFE